MLSRRLLVKLYNWNESFFAKRSLKFKRFRPIRAIRRRFVNYVISNCKKDFVEIDGRKMFLDKNDSLRLSFKEYDKFGTKFVESKIKKGDIVVDLGANIGFWTLFLAQKVGPSGKVYAFEPEPTLFSILKKNVEINGYQNVILNQKAVSNYSGKAKLYLSTNPNDHRIFDKTGTRKSVNIETISLDRYFENNEQINFIKSNIQGADFFAIKGANKLIENSPNIHILAEFSPYMLVEFNCDPRESLNNLIEKNFHLYDLNDKKGKISSINIEDFLKEYSPEKITGTYLYASQEKLNC